MTAALAVHPAASPFDAEPRFAAAGLGFALSLAVTLAAAAVDPRLFQGDELWLKPIKFQIALTIFFLTLAYFARWLPAGMTGRRWWRAYASLVVAATVVEMLWIAGAAMAGVGSHYNQETALMANLYRLMGLFAVFFTSATLVMGIAIWRNRASDLAPALRLALGLGLVLTFVLTLPTAGTLAQMPGHFVGAPVTGATVPVFGWSREVGDLRTAHFLATHAMHVIPLAGLAAVLALPDRLAKPAVWLVAAGFVALVAWAFTTALAGQPLIA